MQGIEGYDNWKLSYPPEYDQLPCCTACNAHEVEFEADELCGDCYYEKHHGLVIAYLDDATRHIQQHFDNGTPYDIKHAHSLLSLALRQLGEIGGPSDAE